MSDCERMEASLNDLADGELSGPAAREVTAHLESCAGCRDTLQALRALKAEAAALPDSIPPARDLWPEIERKLEEDRAGPFAFVARRRAAPLSWGWMAGLAAAAVVLVALTATLTMMLTRPERPAPRASVAPAGDAVLASYRAAEDDYLRATEDLRDALEQRRGELSPETIALVEKNLRIIDEAIRQTRAALQQDPDDPRRRRLFNSLYQKKVMLLQQAIRLPSQS